MGKSEIAQTQEDELVREPTLSLSEESQEVLRIALEGAASVGRGQWIDTSDLLVGLSKVGVLGQTLGKAGVNPESIRKVKMEIGGYKHLNRANPPSNQSSAIQAWKQIPMTVRLHKIAMMATKKVLNDGRESINPEDILDVIMEEGEAVLNSNVGAQILKRLGVNRSGLSLVT